MISSYRSEPFSAEDLYAHISQSVAHHEESLAGISEKIHSNPELKYKEFQAHDNISNLMESLGYTVTRHSYGIETSFEVEFGQGGEVVVFNAEYDALPELGHGCGHNLIATSSIAAFIAAAEAIRDSGIEGRVRLLGTPAEEGGGGKIQLIRAGAYKDVGACIMAHPMGGFTPAGGEACDGISAATSLARDQVNVTFQGQNAHAGFSPWKGRNALDALVASYVNISLLRQQLPPSARIHGVVRQGGTAPNIIPDSTHVEYYIRDSTSEAIRDLSKKVDACFHAGALAAGCTAECVWDRDGLYKELVPNIVLAREFTRHCKSFGLNYIEQIAAGIGGASTDMGNVTYEIPGIHPVFNITMEPDVLPHTAGFTVAAGTKQALNSALDCAKGMAATGYGFLTSSEVSLEAKKEFEKTFGGGHKI